MSGGFYRYSDFIERKTKFSKTIRYLDPTYSYLIIQLFNQPKWNLTHGYGTSAELFMSVEGVSNANNAGIFRINL